MRIAVVGSVNLDLIAKGARLPRPGETVTGAELASHPGGKGANQALAARRLGAEVYLLACVGADNHADEALALLRRDGVDLAYLRRATDVPTGVALIAVDAHGENQIIVAPGANRALGADFDLPVADALILQLEVPLEAIAHAVDRWHHAPTVTSDAGSGAGQSAVGKTGAPRLLVMNLAPATQLPDGILAAADVLVVNESEAAFYGPALQRCAGLLAITAGARGANLWRDGREIARASAPAVRALDTVGAGDAFVAALTVALLERQPYDRALAFACAAGAAATLRAGAQPALPQRRDVLALLGSKP